MPDSAAHDGVRTSLSCKCSAVDLGLILPPLIHHHFLWSNRCPGTFSSHRCPFSDIPSLYRTVDHARIGLGKLLRHLARLASKQQHGAVYRFRESTGQDEFIALTRLPGFLQVLFPRLCTPGNVVVADLIKLAGQTLQNRNQNYASHRRRFDAMIGKFSADIAMNGALEAKESGKWDGKSVKQPNLVNDSAVVPDRQLRR